MNEETAKKIHDEIGSNVLRILNRETDDTLSPATGTGLFHLINNAVANALKKHTEKAPESEGGLDITEGEEDGEGTETTEA
jgi:hypothetical protein